MKFVCFSDDKHLSFIADKAKNVPYDRGIGKGGPVEARDTNPSECTLHVNCVLLKITSKASYCILELNCLKSLITPSGAAI